MFLFCLSNPQFVSPCCLTRSRRRCHFVENARRNTFPKYSQFYSSDHNQQHSTQLDRSLTKSDRCKVHYSAITHFLVGVKLSSIIKVIKWILAVSDIGYRTSDQTKKSRNPPFGSHVCRWDFQSHEGQEIWVLRYRLTNQTKVSLARPFYGYWTPYWINLFRKGVWVKRGALALMLARGNVTFWRF